MNAVSGLLTPAAPVLAAGTSIDNSKPGLIAFLIILAMGLALWGLLKSMGKQLGRAKDHFEAEDATLIAQAGAGTTAGTTVGTAEAVAEVPKQDGAKEPKKDAAAE